MSRVWDAIADATVTRAPGTIRRLPAARRRRAARGAGRPARATSARDSRGLAPACSAGDARAVVDRDLGDARARGAALGEQLGADERAAGPQVEALRAGRGARAGTRSRRRGPAGRARRGRSQFHTAPRSRRPSGPWRLDAPARRRGRPQRPAGRKSVELADVELQVGVDEQHPGLLRGGDPGAQRLAVSAVAAAWTTRRTRGSRAASAAATATVSSLLPSSTTTISCVDRAALGGGGRVADGVGDVLGLVEARQHDGQAAEGIG